jgi:hypothetical protein
MLIKDLLGAPRLAWGALVTILVISTLAAANLHLEAGGVAGANLLSQLSQLTVAIFAPLLAGTLFAREYAQETRMFLLALPVRPSLVFLSKFAFGCGFIVLLQGAPSIVVAVFNELAGQGGGKAIFRIFVHSASFGVFLYAAAICCSMFGRFRHFLTAAVLLAIYVVFKNLPPADVPIFLRIPALEPMRPDAAVQWRDCAATLLSAGALALAAAATLAVRQGDWVARLYRPLTHIEKLVGGMAAVVLLLTAFNEQAHREDMVNFGVSPTDVRRAGDGLTVTVSGSTQAAVADRVAQSVLDELIELQAKIGMKLPGQVLIYATPDLEAHSFRHQAMLTRSSIVLHANIEDRAFRLESLTSWLIPQVLAHASGPWNLWFTGEQAALARGFALYWAHRSHQGQLADLEELALRALYVASSDLPRRAGDWFRVEQRYGTPIADALAFSLLWSVRANHGAPTVLELVRRALFPSKIRSIRRLLALWHGGSIAESVWQDALGFSLDDMHRQWHATLAVSRASLSDALAGLPRLEAELFFLPGSSDSERRLGYQLGNRGDGVGPPTILYLRRGAFEAPVDSDLATREAFPGMDVSGSSFTSFPIGERLAVTVSARSDKLGCEVISGWQYLVVPP